MIARNHARTRTPIITSSRWGSPDGYGGGDVMSKISPEKAALIERIKIAGAALEIPQEAVDHVVKHGTSYHRSKAAGVLIT